MAKSKAKKAWRTPASPQRGEQKAKEVDRGAAARDETAAPPAYRNRGNYPASGRSNYGEEAAQLRVEQEQKVLETRKEFIDDLTAKQAADKAQAEEYKTKEKPARQQGQLYSFVLLGGEHDNGDGTFARYKKTEETVVKSPFRLDQVFMNKYRFLGGPTSAGRDFQDVFDRPNLVDPPAAELFPHGRPSDFDGDIGEKAMAELKRSREGATRAESGEEGETVEGEDVTDQFPGAAAADLKVFKQGREYHVTDASDPDHALNAEEKLTTKGQVEKFIAEND